MLGLWRVARFPAMVQSRSRLHLLFQAGAGNPLRYLKRAEVAFITVQYVEATVIQD